jgi:hypothetical protein
MRSVPIRYKQDKRRVQFRWKSEEKGIVRRPPAWEFGN